MILEFDHPNFGLEEYCKGCQHKLDKGVESDKGLFFCDQALIYEGVLLQIPWVVRDEKCMDYGIPSPYDEQIGELIKGKKSDFLAKLPEGLPDGLSEELLFYTSIVAKYHQFEH